jgi:hypothetical protein
MITEAYRTLNAQLHARQRDFGTSGAKWAPLVLELVHRLGARDVLDYGCGKQTLAGLIGHAVECRGYDPAIDHLVARPRPADLVTCTDVMEHVEPAFVAQVLDDVAGLARLGAFFVISCVRGTRRLPNGRFAHLSVHDRKWWRALIAARFASLESFPQRSKTPELVVLARHARAGAAA